MTEPDISTTQARRLDFLNDDLRGSILAAASAQKSLLCFLTDDSSTSEEWESLLKDQNAYPRLSQIVAVRIKTDTQESQYLNSVVPSVSAPAIVVIYDGQIKHHYQSSGTTISQLEAHLKETYGLEDGSTTTTTSTYLVFPSSNGRMRLPNNAYDAMSTQTQKWVDQRIRGDNILRLQLRLLSNIPELQEAVEAIKSRSSNSAPVLPDTAENRLLNMPASALSVRPAPVSPANSVPSATNRERPTSPAPIPLSRSSSGDSSSGSTRSASAGVQSAHPQQQAQRKEYIRLQRERETAEKAEKERIKAAIKSQQEERRQQEKLRKEQELAALRERNSTTAQPSSTDIRLQVRAFDGHAMTTSFPRTATIATDVRPWVDEVAKQSVPYNLKIMLAPTRNRDIQAGEEEKALSDLGIVGSATMIMVPVKHYVESYSNRGTGIIPAVTGAAGSVISTINWLFGWDRTPATPEPVQSHSAVPPRQGSPMPRSGSPRIRTLADQRNDEGQNNQRPMTPPSRHGSPIPRSGSPRIRTLADQRADEASKLGNELYNGNQLNFQGKKSDDHKNK